ncbi:hypothetical protein [Amphiplicatus metriothermophilus]|uniref:Uncharacterized protein n=1 Tax=Amphiplicatus metriothermophilus TaxID=1519374 RepID=A0A239PVG5_9PROT|nr:hypothetical protein [Amphiplicatus metriothermophilus]MBB5519682.1 hypothetical protein [Amphiplicatus metriothermophilus]SNT74245.1 hypothetical protein SAMN06297382_2156 [Amphiplicatus metriothermophilus]
MTDVQALAADPCWLPEAYDAARGVLRFARIDRAGLAREPFLDRRMEGSVTARAEASLDAVARALGRTAPAPVPAFIFHTAFCCSTLLARALDAPGACLSLKEPNILLDLANAGRVDERLRRDPAAFARLFQLVARLLARPHAQGERVLIKPTNTASTLAQAALAAGSPCLFLYGDLEEFLISILKKGEEGRVFARQLYNIFALDGVGLAAIPPRQAMGFTDLQVAAVVWRHQIEQFAQLLAAAPAGARIASLDFRRLLAGPARTLKAVSRALDLPISDEALEAAAAGEIFARNAKFADQTYDAAKREAEEKALRERWRAELDIIGRWAGQLHLGADARFPLPRALAA